MTEEYYRKSRGYRRAINRKKKNKLLRTISYCGYKGGVPYIRRNWEDGIWYSLGNHIQYPNNSNAKVYWKKFSNKAVRREGKALPKGNVYRKIFDYKWKID